MNRDDAEIMNRTLDLILSALRDISYNLENLRPWGGRGGILRWNWNWTSAGYATSSSRLDSL